MKLISINYRKADALVRGNFSFDADKRRELREALAPCVILCTCNRTEIYFTEADMDNAVQRLAYQAGIGDISEYLNIYDGIGAVRHLFRVASGIDSMIIGEDEILRQVKEAYSESADNGSTDFELNTVFQAAIAAAKLIKTRTALSTTPVSAATIAANEAVKLGADVNVLMIGASGKIGSSVLRNLMTHTGIHITQTARIHKCMTDRDNNVTTISYDRRYEYMDKADCIISATASPHFTVTAVKLKAALHTQKNRLLIDLAVPSDIERTVTGIRGVRYIGIDDLAALSKHGNKLRLSAAQQADDIISEKVDELQKKLLFRKFLSRLENAGKAFSDLTFDELIYKLRDGLDSIQFEAVLKVLCDSEG